MKLGGKRSFFVGPLGKYRWRALLPQTVSADERMNLFAEGLEAIGKAEHLPALCLDPQPSDRILDPACGTGGFLVSCYKHILAKHTSLGSTIAGDKLTHGERQKVYSNLAGYDVTDLMVKLSKVICSFTVSPIPRFTSTTLLRMKRVGTRRPTSFSPIRRS